VTDRQKITADHSLHNTLADCATGLKNGTTPGAPDSLLTDSPPGLINAPYFNYSSDVTTAPAKGIQIQPETQTSPPCTFGATGSTNPQTKFHVWLSDPMPSAGPFYLSGRVTLSFFSRTFNGTPYPGKICIWLFRDTPGSGQPKYLGATASATSPTWTYPAAGPYPNWPTSYTTNVNEPPTAITTFTTLTDNDLRINPNSRLGLAISVAKDVTPSPLEFMYDHAAFPAHLEIDTTTPLG
jgi:hypothetical protein